MPLILWTSFLLATNTPALTPVPAKYGIPNLPPNLGTLATYAYCGLYILLEPVAGGALSALLLVGTAYANHLTNIYSPSVNYWAAAVNVICWIAQFIGHGRFEGRAPALLDNLYQAFLLAPLFVWLELWFRLGYRPELKSRLDKMVMEDIAIFRQSRGDSRSKGELDTKLPTQTNGHAISG